MKTIYSNFELDTYINIFKTIIHQIIYTKEGSLLLSF